MDFYNQAPFADASILNSSPFAKPTARVAALNITVLKIEKGMFRDAQFRGIFWLDEEKTAENKTNVVDWNIAIVNCLWFGTRLETRGIELKYKEEGSEILYNYTGEIVSNISLKQLGMSLKAPLIKT